MATQIPESVRHSDLMEALKPLHDLLGISSKEIYASGFSLSLPQQGAALGSIALFVTARAEGDDEARPKGVQKASGIQPAPNPTAELAWVAHVRID